MKHLIEIIPPINSQIIIELIPYHAQVSNYMDGKAGSYYNKSQLHRKCNFVSAYAEYTFTNTNTAMCECLSVWVCVCRGGGVIQIRIRELEC